MEKKHVRACIDFLITQKCNYRCEYCSQSKKFYKNTNHASNETIEAFLKFIKTLDKDFEITISGGEPLFHPRFFEVVEEIKKCNLKLSVISNFSFPVENYKKIADIMGENLVELFVSYHSSQIKDVEEFKKKVVEFNSYKPAPTIFSAASVLSDENYSDLKKLSEFLKQTGVKFCLQHMRIKNDYVEYNTDAAEFLAQNATPEPGRVLNTFSKMCYAGYKFLLIYENGEAYRCYSSRFNRAHYLGNIKDKNFKMFNCPMPCINSKCTCPKPISYNMLDLKHSNKFLSTFLLGKNVFYLPYLVAKNIDVLKAKFEQGLFLKK